MSFSEKICKKRGISAFAAGLIALLCFTATEVQALRAPQILAPHESSYSVRMTDRNAASPLVSINGEMSYHLDDTCDGWTVSQSFSLNYLYSNQRGFSEKKHFTNWEAKDGSGFQFASKSMVNGEVSDEFRGSATQKNGNGNGHAEFKTPQGLSFDFEQKTLFPNQYILELLKRAEKGEKFYNMVWFDGADESGLVEVNTFIGEPLTKDEITALRLKLAKNPKITAALLTDRAWRMRLAFFPLSPSEDTEGGTPSHEMDIILHDNGIVSEAAVHFGSFTIVETLQSLEPKKKTGC